MVDDWFVGAICHRIPGLFPFDGQGLLQHDKHGSARKHYCVKSPFAGVIRLDRCGYLPN
jgi:hypothetical protein